MKLGYIKPFVCERTVLLLLFFCSHVFFFISQWCDHRKKKHHFSTFQCTLVYFGFYVIASDFSLLEMTHQTCFITLCFLLNLRSLHRNQIKEKDLCCALVCSVIICARYWSQNGGFLLFFYEVSVKTLFVRRTDFIFLTENVWLW